MFVKIKIEQIRRWPVAVAVVCSRGSTPYAHHGSGNRLCFAAPSLLDDCSGNTPKIYHTYRRCKAAQARRPARRSLPAATRTDRMCIA